MRARDRDGPRSAGRCRSRAHRVNWCSRLSRTVFLCASTRSRRRAAAWSCRSSTSAAGRMPTSRVRTSRARVVLGDSPIGQLWNRAVRDRGAAGVISTDLAAYARPESTPEVLQWGSIPFDEARRSFGFKSTPRAAGRLRAALAAGAVRVHVDIATAFHRGPSRTLIAEIPGGARADERVVLVAHVQEPGANDNASGVGTLLAAAQAIREAIRQRLIPPPQRTITFMWLDENRGSEQWIKDHPARAKQVVAMMSLDMTGEDTVEDRRDVSDREVAGSLRDLAASVRSALGVGRRPRRPRARPRSPAQRSAPRRRAPPRSRHRLGRAHQSLRGRKRPHGLHAGRRPGPPELAFHRSLLPHQSRHHRQGERRDDAERRDDRGDDGDIPGVGGRLGRR